jgi:1-deoxy-D-xylulose 5-phosphate reductoisomerase
MAPAQIEVVIHPEHHPLHGPVPRQLGCGALKSDMRVPTIAYGPLGQSASVLARRRWISQTLANMTLLRSTGVFRFAAGLKCSRRPSAASAAVLNAANEIAVAAF